MERLFLDESSEKMLSRLAEVEAEMREDSYSEREFGLEYTARNAKDYIKVVFSYVKKHYKSENCTTLSLITELYRIAVTGEYSYLQQISDIGFKDELLSQMQGDTGRKEVIYAVRLLRYYFLIKEKDNHPQKEWKEIENLCKKICELGPLIKSEKKSKTLDISEEGFIPALRKHLDQYMIGQDILKKKICTILFQYKYHDVKTTLLMIGPTGSGKNHLINSLKKFQNLGFPVISYDCSSLTPNGFTGSEVKDIFKLVSSVMKSESLKKIMNNLPSNNKKAVVYLDEIDKILVPNHDSNGENIHSFVQNALLTALAGTEIVEGVDTSKLLFILGGAFSQLDDIKKERKNIGFNSGLNENKIHIEIKDNLREQIIDFGAEREFLGRISDIVRISKLNREDLRRILMDKNIGEFTKKQEIYQASGMTLNIDEDMIDSIIDLIEQESAGARGVKNVVNQLADPQYFYDMVVRGYDTLRIHKGMLDGEAPLFFKGGVSSAEINKDF